MPLIENECIINRKLLKLEFENIYFYLVFGRWSPEEDAQLREAVKTAVTDNANEEEAYFNFPWTEIARGVPTRNAKQCRDHW